MCDQKFIGKDPVFVLDILTRLVEETDTLDMSEGHLIFFLLNTVTNNAAQYFRSNSSHRHYVGLVCWLDAVQYLLHTY